MYDGSLNNPLRGGKIMKSFQTFCTDEDGAVTVDWVVLTAAVVGLAVLAFIDGAPIEQNAYQNSKTSRFGRACALLIAGFHRFGDGLVNFPLSIRKLFLVK